MAKRVRKKPAKRKTPIREPYNAAGLSKDGLSVVINDAEYKRMGLAGYPWSKKLKARMLKACDGLKTISDVHAKIDELASTSA